LCGCSTYTLADERDMVENRHRLNAAVVQDQADAAPRMGPALCPARGSYRIHARRKEMTFYQALLIICVTDTTRGHQKQGRAPFVMTIFQKDCRKQFRRGPGDLASGS
jgi:hypothetical protein